MKFLPQNNAIIHTKCFCVALELFASYSNSSLRNNVAKNKNKRRLNFFVYLKDLSRELCGKKFNK